VGLGAKKKHENRRRRVEGVEWEVWRWKLEEERGGGRQEKEGRRREKRKMRRGP
jgi:hypothetical protein